MRTKIGNYAGNPPEIRRILDYRLEPLVREDLPPIDAKGTASRHPRGNGRRRTHEGGGHEVKEDWRGIRGITKRGRHAGLYAAFKPDTIFTDV
jgi:hypothetical protein